MTSFAKKYVTISDRDTDIIMHCRKSLLFDNETAWTKKDQNNMFDVTMGSFDGAGVCELIGLFILNILSDKYDKNNVGLYRDDGLVLLRNTSGPQSEQTRKDITREFKKQGLDITISTNLKICNFLDVTNHTVSFRTETKRNATELSKHIWALQDRKSTYKLTWKIVACATPYSNTTKRCNLCLTEKYFILCKPQTCRLNRRNELASACRHTRKFLLKHI